MEFTQEGLQQRALAVVGFFRHARRRLPAKLTDKLKQQGDAWLTAGLPHLQRNPIYRQAILDCFDHRELGLGLIVFLTPKQCESGAALETTDALISQILYSPVTLIAEMPRIQGMVPPVPNPYLQNTAKVWVRVEVLLTSEEDNWIQELFVIDPRNALPDTPADLDTLRRRAARETGLPKEVIKQTMDMLLEQPEEVFDALVKQHGGETRMHQHYMKQLRACANPACGKYGITLLKCSVCRTTYYCGSDCQLADWPVHKESCCRHK